MEQQEPGWAAPQWTVPTPVPTPVPNPGAPDGPPAPQAPPGWGGQPPGGTGPPGGWGGPPAGWSGPPPDRPGLRRGVVPLRPLGLSELLDGTVAVVRRYPRAVFAFSAVVAVVSAALQLMVTLTFLLPFLRLDDEQLSGDLSQASEELAGLATGSAFTVLFGVFAGLVLTGLVAPAVSRGTLGQELSAGQAWRQLRPQLAPLAGVSLLVTLAVFGAPLAAVALTVTAAAASGVAGALLGLVLVPLGVALAVYLYVRWAFAPLCVVLEKQGVRAALSRSGILVKQSWWRVLGVLLLTALVAGFVSQVLQVPFLFGGGNPISALSGQDTDTSTSVFVVSAIGAMFAATLVGPFTAGVTGLLYVDRRMRTEGLDVALAAALSAGPSAGTAAGTTAPPDGR